MEAKKCTQCDKSFITNMTNFDATCWKLSCHCNYWVCFKVYTTLGLTHWGRVTHICVDNITIIGSDNGLSPGWRQAIIWTNAGILLIRPLGTNFSEILIGNQTFSFKKIHLKMSSAKWHPFCFGLNVLTGLHLGGESGDILIKSTALWCWLCD